MRGTILALGITLCFGIVEASSRYTVELYLVVDDKVKDVYIRTGTTWDDVESTIRQDVLYIVSEINNIFQRMRGKGLDIDVKLARLDVLSKNVFPSARNGRIQNIAGINDFVAHLKDTGAQSRYGYDIALLLTGYDLLNQARSNSIIGRGRFNTVCKSENVGITVFKGTYKAALFMAHEMLHILGVLHDIEYSKKCEDGRWLMGVSIYRRPKNKWDASDCTINALKKGLPAKECLRTTRRSSYTPDVNVPKDLLDMDLMCKRSGFAYMCKEPIHYNMTVPRDSSVCQGVVCFDSRRNKCYRTIHSTNGLPCGKGKRCNFNRCEYASNVPAHIKDDCVFGDQLALNVNGRTTTCEEYFKRESKTERCRDDTIKHQCCKTCQTYQTNNNNNNGEHLNGGITETDQYNSRPGGKVIARKRCSSRNYATEWCRLRNLPAGVNLELVLVQELNSNTCKYGTTYKLERENGEVYIKVSDGCSGNFQVKTKGTTRG